MSCIVCRVLCSDNCILPFYTNDIKYPFKDQTMIKYRQDCSRYQDASASTVSMTRVVLFLRHQRTPQESNFMTKGNAFPWTSYTGKETGKSCDEKNTAGNNNYKTNINLSTEMWSNHKCNKKTLSSTNDILSTKIPYWSQRDIIVLSGFIPFCTHESNWQHYSIISDNSSGPTGRNIYAKRWQSSWTRICVIRSQWQHNDITKVRANLNQNLWS